MVKLIQERMHGVRSTGGRNDSIDQVSAALSQVDHLCRKENQHGKSQLLGLRLLFAFLDSCFPLNTFDFITGKII